jgi:hypothetical protein
VRLDHLLSKKTLTHPAPGCSLAAVVVAGLECGVGVDGMWTQHERNSHLFPGLLGGWAHTVGFWENNHAAFAFLRARACVGGGGGGFPVCGRLLAGTYTTSLLGGGLVGVGVGGWFVV